MAIKRTITADVSAPQGFRVDGEFEIHGSGTFGGGTVQLERRQLDKTFLPVIGADYTAAFDDVVTADVNGVYRFAMSGSTSPDVVIEITRSFDEPV